MLKNFRQNLLIFSVALISACSSNNSDQPKIRIVDLEGKSHPIVTKTPELNVQALAMQGKAPEQVRFYNDTPKNTPSYGNLIEQTLQIPQNQQKATAISQGQKIQTPIIQAQDNQQQNTSIGQTQDNQQIAATQTLQKPQENSQDFAEAQNQQSIEYDLVSPTEDQKTKTNEKPLKIIFKKEAKSPVTGSKKIKGFFVQIGSFSNEISADEMLKKASKFGKGHVELSEDKKLYRALLGPAKNKPAAQALLKKVKASGYEAVLKKND